MGKQVFADGGLSVLAKRMCRDDFRYHLFTNDYTPVRESLTGNFTEAGWVGYAIVDVAYASFVEQAVVGHVGSVLAPTISFLNVSGAPVNTYGYYVTNLAETIVFFASRFETAPRVIPDGDALPLIPSLADRSKDASS